MKRHFKKIALAVALTGTLVVGASGVAFAGGGHKHGFGGPGTFQRLENMEEQERLEYLENMLDKRVQRMTEKLELTKAQQVKVRQVMADAQTQMLEIYEKNKGLENKEAGRAEAKVIMKQSRQDVKDILTDAQRAKLKEEHGKRGKRMKGKLAERLDEKLELSDTQRTKVDTILEGAHKQLKELRGQEGEQEAKRAQAKKIMTAAADDIEAVLDENQKAEFAQMRERLVEHAGKRGKGKKGGKRGQRGAF